MLDNSYAKAQEILRNNMAKLDKVAQALMEKEVISSEEFEELIK